MTTKVKFWLTYVGGIVTGIVLTFVLALIAGLAQQGQANAVNRDVTMFEKPQQVIVARNMEVMQVLPNGSALAIIKKPYDNYGTVVALQAMQGGSYYDDQKISIPEGKCLRQIGTYRYMTQQNMEKTVPVVQVFDN